MWEVVCELGDEEGGRSEGEREDGRGEEWEGMRDVGFGYGDGNGEVI